MLLSSIKEISNGRIIAHDADFKEQEHPRDENGKFSEKNEAKSIGEKSSLIEIPNHHKVLFKNEGFELEKGEVLLAHSTPKKNVNSIKEKGLVKGTGTSGGVSSVGSFDLWAWSNPESALKAIKSNKEAVVLFAVEKEKVVYLPDTHAIYIKNGEIPLKKIFAITLAKSPTTDSSILVFQGLRINIENPKGSVRKGEDENGDAWKTKMFYPYGEIVGTEGVDGDPIDCFVGPDKNADKVFIVREKIDGKYDEDKVMLGFADELHARDAFLAHYDDTSHLGKIVKMNIEDFKKAIQNHKRGTKIGA